MNVFLLAHFNDFPIGVFTTKDAVKNFLSKKWENIQYREFDNKTEVYIDDCESFNYIITQFELMGYVNHKE